MPGLRVTRREHEPLRQQQQEVPLQVKVKLPPRVIRVAKPGEGEQRQHRRHQGRARLRGHRGVEFWGGSGVGAVWFMLTESGSFARGSCKRPSGCGYSSAPTSRVPQPAHLHERQFDCFLDGSGLPVQRTFRAAFPGCGQLGFTGASEFVVSLMLLLSVDHLYARWCLPPVAGPQGDRAAEDPRRLAEFRPRAPKSCCDFHPLS